jgi:hypothetical protein
MRPWASQLLSEAGFQPIEDILDRGWLRWLWLVGRPELHLAQCLEYLGVDRHRLEPTGVDPHIGQVLVNQFGGLYSADV